MALGKSVPHDSALGHVTGRSVYVDDRPLLEGELWVDVVGAPVAKGKLVAVHAAEALKVPGVVGVFTAKDLAHNRWGTVVKEQPILVDSQIGHRDEPVCLVAASTREALREAKRKIRVECQEEKALLTIDEAIARKSFLYEPSPFARGNPDEKIRKAKHRLKGELFIEGQEHFYLESQAAVAYPLEHGQMEIHSSTQHTTETQHVVAHALGLSYHQVVCICKRMGGAFGGKESQAAPFAAMAALVAQKTGKPARLILTKDDDMKMTGKRHPFKIFYEVGFDDQGRIEGLRAELYSDAGAYTDLSCSILDRAMFHLDGAYFLSDVFIQAKACRTNNQSHTAFRGFGGPQGMMVIESILEDVASHLKKEAFEIRRLNCYQDDRKITPYGQEVEHLILPKIFDDLHASSEYSARLREIEGFNRANSGKVRGLSMTATKFGISFTARFLNQANALVNLHRDGSVQVSTGATEMGQGVNTKIQQTVAHAFGLDPSRVLVLATSTDKNANTSPTAASSGADLNCAAAALACEQIKTRLSHVAFAHFSKVDPGPLGELEAEGNYEGPVLHFVDGKVKDPTLGREISLRELIDLAYHNRISLSGYGHYKTPGIGFDKKTNQGKPFNYFTNGAAVSEVEVDLFTGEMKVRRVDLLMDIGRPMNPGIDLGQITGAFIQGMGWLTSEKLFYKNGELLSHSPTTYKIPNIQDTPRVFNIALYPNDKNSQSFYRAKAVGEPPFLLGISVWTAVKNAIARAREHRPFVLAAPATPEAILAALHHG